MLKVRNKGRMDGDEVVQVYMSKREDADGPQKALRAFRRVHIPAGQSVTLRIPLDDSVFATYDEASGELRATPGHFTLYYGPSADNHLLKRLRIRKK